MSYQAVFTSGRGPEARQRLEIICIEKGLRLEDDDHIYNAYGIQVARFKGFDENGNFRIENLRLETEWENAKILRG